MTTTQAPSDPVLQAPKKPRSRLNRIFTIVWAVVLGCVVLAIAVYVFVVRGVIGEPADLHTSERTTQAFVAALAANQPEQAYDMLATEARAHSSLDDVRAMATQFAQAGYSDLRICEFQLTFGATGKQLIGLGVLRHAQGLSGIQSTLLQEADGRWRVLAFTIENGVDAKPWGACQVDPP